MDKSIRGWLRIGLGVLGMLLVLGLVFRLNRQLERLQALRRTERALATEVDALSATERALQARLTEAASDAQVEQWAHGEAHWVREGEVLVVPQPVSSALATPTPTSTPQPVARWRLWWALLFGSSAP